VTLVTLYGKPGCHLCEEAREVVLRVRDDHGFDLEEVDVSLDPALHRDYGERIPVVAVDGEEAFQYHVDGEALRRLLVGAPPDGR
jgi:glutaredoxin